MKGITPENSHVMFCPYKQRSFEPLVCLDLVLTKTSLCTSFRDKGKGLEPSAWIDDDDFRTSRRAHGTLGITFDVFSYRARKEVRCLNVFLTEYRIVIVYVCGRG